MFMDTFDTMPLACEVNHQYLCMHGGISPHFTKVSEIDAIKRFCEPPHTGLMADLLWSDPLEEKQAKEHDFIPNSSRDTSVMYGFEAV